MKSIKLFLTLVSLIFFIGCSTSTDSNENSTPPNTVIDYDGNTYALATICNQVWTKTNLKVSHYCNGDVIPQVKDVTQWKALTTGAWCYYENTTSNGTTYDKLYNWYAVHDPRGLAPTGYHIPTDAEWTTLTACLGGESVAGVKMKAATLWNSTNTENTEATNSSGFTGLPGGYRNQMAFYTIGSSGYWWSSTETNTISAWSYNLDSSDDNVDKNARNKLSGFSVRCLKNPLSF